MDGVAISIIGRPRPLPGHDTPNAAHNTYTLKCEEPVMWVQAARRQHAESARMYVVPPVIMVIGYILVRLSMFAIGSLDI